MMLSIPSTPSVFWFLPTHGDGRYLGTSIGGRRVDIHYLRQIAQAADRLGIRGRPTIASDYLPAQPSDART